MVVEEGRGGKGNREEGGGRGGDSSLHLHQYYFLNQLCALADLQPSTLKTAHLRVSQLGHDSYLLPGWPGERA